MNTTVHESILGAVDWTAFVGQPGAAARDQVDESIARYRQSLARFLR